jgi:hypothetical protein
MPNEFRESLAPLPCCSKPWIWIAKSSQSRIKKFIGRRSVAAGALPVERPAKYELRRTILFSSHSPEPMVDQRRFSDSAPGNNCNDVVPVRGVMSARSLPGGPVLLMDVKTGHWIG